MQHEIKVYAKFWNARKINAQKKQIEYFYLYSGLVPMFFDKMSPETMKVMSDYLRSHPESAVLNELYVSLDRIVSSDNATEFLPLLRLPVAEVRKRIARLICKKGQPREQRLVLTEIHGLGKAGSIADRAVAVALCDLFPDEERQQILTAALNDKSHFVIEAAVRKLDPARDRKLFGLLKKIAARKDVADDERLRYFINRVLEK